MAGKLRVPLIWVFSVLIGSIFLGPLNPLEMLFQDAHFIISTALTHASGDDTVVFVLLDSKSEKDLHTPFGTAWREFFPGFIETLHKAGAKVIVFDLEFLSREDRFDGALAGQISAAGNVVAGEWDYNTTAETLKGAFSAVGSLRVEAISGKPRSIRLTGEAGELPLSVVAAQTYAGRDLVQPVADAGRFWIYFDRAPETYHRFSFSDVYAAEGGRIADVRRTPLSLFKDRIVLVGIDLPGTDRHSFPHTLEAGVAGVYGQAAAIETVLSGRFLYRLPVWLNLSILAVYTALYCFALDASGSVLRRILAPVIPVTVFVVSVLLFSKARVWIGFSPLFAASVAAVTALWMVNRRIIQGGLRKAIGFDPELVDNFRKQAKDGIVQAKVAVLCADVRDFTALVSSAGPDKVSKVMNEYLHAMEEIICSHGGYVNKYVGDEIIAVFGFPLSGGNAVLRAVKSATAMLTALGRLVAVWTERGIRGVERIGIGIDYGTVTCAEMGGRSRRQFDIIGNAVNGASRLQTLTKDLNYHLAVPREVYNELLEEDGEKELVGDFIPVGAYSIRGQGERLVYVYSKAVSPAV